jgi:hypothetical protein
MIHQGGMVQNYRIPEAIATPGTVRRGQVEEWFCGERERWKG